MPSSGRKKKGLTPRRSGIETPPTFGRDEDAARVLAALDRGRLVTLTGPAGIGKSHLALHALRSLGESPRVIRCALADATSEEGRTRELRRALGVRPGSRSEESPRAALVRALGEGPPTWVLLDDADDAIPWTARLIAACAPIAAARFLVTSREPVRIDTEQVIEVRPLGPEAARAMFYARAGDFGGEEADVTALLSLLEGIPLAIELAARRAHLLSPGQWVSRIDERFRLLRSDRRDVPARHASLAAALEGSWERLTPDERVAFSVLGVFAGPIPLEAFEAVVAPLLRRDPVEVAEALLQKSMITSVPSSGAARLGILGTLRAFARSCAEASVLKSAEDGHARYFVERAERAAAAAYGAGAEEALDQLELDLPNLLAAFSCARVTAPERAARIAVAVADLAITRDVMDLRSSFFADGRKAADDSKSPELMARARIAEAKAQLELGNASQAEALLAEALQRCATASLHGTRADVLRSLGWALLALGRPNEASVALAAALEHYATSPHARGHADALAARAMVRWGTRDVEGAREDLEAAHAIHVVCGDSLRREAVVDMAGIAGIDLRPGAPSAEVSAERLRASAEAHRAAGRSWREALDRLRLAATLGSGEERARELDLARAAAAVSGANQAVTAALSQRRAAALAANSGPPWRVGPEARWVIPPGGPRRDLTRYGSLRRTLDVLVARRLEAPGASTSAAALLEAAWPGERVRHESGMLRVYTAIRRLRALGLGDALVTRDDGYLLSTDVAFERSGG
jgi:predicted ATPase